MSLRGAAEPRRGNLVLLASRRPRSCRGEVISPGGNIFVRAQRLPDLRGLSSLRFALAIPREDLGGLGA